MRRGLILFVVLIFGIYLVGAVCTGPDCGAGGSYISSGNFPEFEYYATGNSEVALTDYDSEASDIHYDYDSESRLISNSMIYARQDFEYDAVGNTIREILWIGNIKYIRDYFYDSNENVEKIILSNSINNEELRVIDEFYYGFDSNGFISSFSGSNYVGEEILGYNDLGNIDYEQTYDGSFYDYDYDEGQIVKASYIYGEEDSDKVETDYTYDYEGKLVEMETEGGYVRIIYDGEDRVSNVISSEMAPTYDWHTGTSTDYEYDDYNQIIEIVTSFGTSYGPNPDENDVMKIVSSFEYDDDGNLINAVAESFNSNGEFLRLEEESYVYGEEGSNEEGLLVESNINGERITIFYDENNNIEEIKGLEGVGDVEYGHNPDGSIHTVNDLIYYYTPAQQLIRIVEPGEGFYDCLDPNDETSCFYSEFHEADENFDSFIGLGEVIGTISADFDDKDSEEVKTLKQDTFDSWENTWTPIPVVDFKGPPERPPEKKCGCEGEGRMFADLGVCTPEISDMVKGMAEADCINKVCKGKPGELIEPIIHTPREGNPAVLERNEKTNKLECVWKVKAEVNCKDTVGECSEGSGEEGEEGIPDLEGGSDCPDCSKSKEEIWMFFMNKGDLGGWNAEGIAAEQLFRVKEKEDCLWEEKEVEGADKNLAVIECKDTESGPIWVFNSNHGEICEAEVTDENPPENKEEWSYPCTDKLPEKKPCKTEKDCKTEEKCDEKEKVCKEKEPPEEGVVVVGGCPVNCGDCEKPIYTIKFNYEYSHPVIVGRERNGNPIYNTSIIWRDEGVLVLKREGESCEWIVNEKESWLKTYDDKNESISTGEPEGSLRCGYPLVGEKLVWLLETPVKTGTREIKEPFRTCPPENEEDWRWSSSNPAITKINSWKYSTGGG